MKKTLTTAFLTLAAAFGFAQEASLDQPLTISNLPVEVKPKVSLEEKASSNKSFVYLRMGVSDTTRQESFKDINVVPGLGLGYRLASDTSALDLSGSYNRRYNRDEEGKKNDTYFYTLPKANYLYYTSPAKDNSLYLGGGLAWGGLKNKTDQEFVGVIPNLAIGYEMNRNAPVRAFVQFDISQAAIAARQVGEMPGPFAELSVGAGF